MFEPRDAPSISCIDAFLSIIEVIGSGVIAATTNITTVTDVWRPLACMLGIKLIRSRKMQT